MNIHTFLARSLTLILFLGAFIYIVFTIDQTGAFDDLSLRTGLLVGGLATTLIGVAVEEIWPD